MEHPIMSDVTHKMNLLPIPEGHIAVPEARRIGFADLSAALDAGAADFRAALGYGLLFGAVYAGLGAGGIALCLWLGWVHLIFPALSGFLLFGPFAALGLYEISRRRAAGQGFGPRDIFLAFRPHGAGQIALYGFFLLLLVNAWLEIASFIYALFYADTPQSFLMLVKAIVTTPRGFAFALTGMTVGAVLAAFAFATSVFAVPMLLDRDVDIVTAILTSVAAVRRNLPTMTAWALIVCSLMAGGMALGLVGLLVALPLIGHATWHLYRRALPPGGDARRAGDGDGR
jgi:uncharacterized membrane protein